MSIYNLYPHGKLKISQKVLETVNKYRQIHSHEPEGGGMLFGRLLIDSPDIVIDELSVPMEGDIRTRFSFHRSHKNHQKVLDCLWESSNKTCHYLGEWHTHPERNPSPSVVDINEWKRIMTKTLTESNMFIFMIVGTEQIRIWQGCRDTKMIHMLKENNIGK